MTVALRGRCSTSAISPTMDPGPFVATCSPDDVDPGRALEDDEALEPDPALVDEDRALLGHDLVGQRRHPRQLVVGEALEEAGLANCAATAESSTVSLAAFLRCPNMARPSLPMTRVSRHDSGAGAGGGPVRAGL